MKKVFKRIFAIFGIIIGVVVLLISGYIGYILLSYNRIGDKKLDIDSAATLTEVKTGEEYKVISYNIGFGAYSQDYTFFLDEGYDENGKSTVGYYSTGRSKKEILFNTEGAIATVKEKNPDFVFFQEVDTNSTRSYHVNEDKMIVETFNAYDHVHAVNFHTAFLPYPLYDMHGIVNGGLTTISKYKLLEAERKSYTVSKTLSKYFDLDRCFSYSTVKVNNGKTLYLVNSHMSAYDAKGEIKEKQVAELNNFLNEHKDDYVVIGGDWNHDLLTYNPEYSYNDTNNRPFGMTLKEPDWLCYYFDNNHHSPLIDGYRVVASDNKPSCRNNDIEWIPGKTFVCTVDGFIVSDNVKVNFHENIQTKNGKKGIDGFAFADHEPAYMTFELL